MGRVAKSVCVSPEIETRLVRDVTKESFYRFVQEFWSVIIPEHPIWNWHIKYLCDEVQVVLERVFAGQPKIYDLIINVPPSTSKSSLFSILLTNWIWTRVASARVIACSYSGALAFDFSRKSRDVFRSEKYQRCFPEIKLELEQAMHFTNTQHGERYCAGIGGAITGKHAHCFPAGTQVSVPDGTKPIEQLQIGDNVLSRGIDGVLVYKKVVAVLKRKGEYLYEIEASGRKVRATPEHKFFVYGQGYKEAQNLRPTDSLLSITQKQSVPKMWKNNKRTGLHVYGLLPDREKRNNSITLRTLRKGSRKKGLRCTKSITTKRKRGILQSKMFCRTQQKKDILCCLRRSVTIKTQSVLYTMSIRKAKDTKIENMSYLWYNFLSGQHKATILYTDMCKQSTFTKNVGHGKFPSQKSRQFSLHSHTNASSYIQKRWICLFSLWSRRFKTSYAPYRYGSTKQYRNKFNNALCFLSYWTTSQKEQCTRIESIKRISGTSEFVYDIEVEETHNFFANGFLVHNCIVIDDPMNPSEAASEAGIRAANMWLHETITTRTVDAKLTPIIMIMQRLHQDDPTGDWISNAKPGSFKHICLPADCSEGQTVLPEEAKANYVDGLFDPVRLPRDLLEQRRSWMGEFGYACQYDQHPIPRSGGMFLVERLRIGHVDPSDPVTFMVRYWDKAVSVKKTACYTVGTKIGRTKMGKYYVMDVVRGRWDSDARERLIRATAEQDGKKVIVGVEMEPGSGGFESAINTVRNLAGFTCKMDKADTHKDTRAEPFSSQVNGYNVTLVPGAWNDEYISELRYFPNSKYKDQVDSSAGAFNLIATLTRRTAGGWS